VSSALDHSARRDPDGATPTITRTSTSGISRTTSTTQSRPCKSTLWQRKTITSSASLYGRF
jgi:hypothetical protein